MAEGTLCRNCKHFENTSPDGLSERWIYHVCKATELPVEVDPSDGKEKYAGTDYQGRKYYTDYPFQLCFRINHGNCPLYLEKTITEKGKFSKSAKQSGPLDTTLLGDDLANMFEMAVENLGAGKEVLRVLYDNERVPILIRDIMMLFIDDGITRSEAHHRLEEPARKIREQIK